MVVFYAMLNVSTINSRVIHTANNQNKKLLHRHFIENLAMNLIEPHIRELAAIIETKNFKSFEDRIFFLFLF